MAVSTMHLMVTLAAVMASASATRHIRGTDLPSQSRHYLPQDYFKGSANDNLRIPQPTLMDVKHTPFLVAASTSGMTSMVHSPNVHKVPSFTISDAAATSNSGGTDIANVTSNSSAVNGTVTGRRRLSQAGVFDSSFRWHGGAVMTGTANVYIMYLGYGSSDFLPAWANYLVANLQGSGLWSMTAKYAQGNTYANGGMSLQKTLYFGNTALDMSTTGVWNFIVQQINQGSLPRDPNGIYIIMPSPTSLAMGRNFGSDACGWHTYGTLGSTSIKIALVPQFPASHICASVHKSLTSSGQTSPSGDYTIDSVMSVLFHELQETVTDPELNGWYGVDLSHESGDDCAWQFSSSDRPNANPKTLSINTWSSNTQRYTSYNQYIHGVPYILQLGYNADPRNSGCMATISSTLRSDSSSGSAPCLATDQCLISASDNYMACMQADGNFVVYARTTSGPGRVSGRALWASSTFPSGPQQMCMQSDGNLVGYTGSSSLRAFWASNTVGRGSGPWRLVMQDDGNLVVYDKNNAATWASNTMQG